MQHHTRLLTGGLAVLAVTSGVTLGSSPAATAADGAGRACGQAAVPATYVTVIREPVLRTVPAVTHPEWRWERTVTVLEQRYDRVVSPAHTETDGTRPAPLEYRWSHTVVDREARDAIPGSPARGHYETVEVSPAATVTLVEYVQQQTGRTRWEDAGWNAETAEGDPGKGWTRTGTTREEVVVAAVTEQVWVVDEAATPGVPAVTELSHVEYRWSTTSPGSDWTGPLDSRPTGAAETTTTVGDESPGPGWVETATREVAAEVEEIWAEDDVDGYTATGVFREKGVTTEQTGSTSALPPGSSWTAVPDSRIDVVDVPETTELLTPGSLEQVEVSPGLPGTEPCPAPTGDGAANPSTSVAGPTNPGSAVSVLHPRAHAGTQAGGGTHAATVLPASGNAVSPLLLTAGVGGLVAGGVLVGFSRRRRTS
jgi:hypothetical protein